MQDNLREKYGELEFSAFDCPLSRTHEKEEAIDDVQKKIKRFILTNLHFGIIAIVGLLVLVGLFIVICRRLKSFRVKRLSSKISQVTRRPTIRRTQIYHDIDETLIMHEPDEIKIENTSSYTLLQKEVESPQNHSKEESKEKDQAQQKSNPSTLQELPDIHEAIKQKDTSAQHTNKSKVSQTEHGEKGLKLEQIQGEIKKKLLEKFELTR
ncbi:uncharacterized protein LOC133181539 [Saccostrea echinata]|uniref:uncharacterized protein LOC133181539 n=1 Tax=Saccostrea echinata TaxID=191078 RepID=UPI002A81EA30|nr:uncharacterized protein LOC133181539 [Saccostrea echinata]